MLPAPGFRLDQRGFKVDQAVGETLKFKSPLPSLSPQQVKPHEALYSGPDLVGLPNRLRINLRTPGFDLHAPLGMELRVSSLTSPFLTTQGTSAEALPRPFETINFTPTTKWAIISFRTPQPPILIGFLGDERPIAVQGSPGSWSISWKGAGWVRIALPNGLRPMAMEQFSAMSTRMNQEAKWWLAEAPALQDLKVTREGDRLRAVYLYDKPGALVPPPVLLAKQGGYDVRVQTGLKRVDADMPDGPTAFTAEPKLALTFPLRELPAGRPLAGGEVISGAAPMQIALHHWLMGIPPPPRAAIDEEWPPPKEPVVLWQDDLKLTAFGGAALGRSLLGAAGGYRDSLRRFLDERTWLPLGRISDSADRSASQLAAACALSSDPAVQLDGVRIRAGLAARATLVRYAEKRDFPEQRPPLLVRPALLELLYPSDFGKGYLGAWEQLRINRHRILSGPQVQIQKEGAGIILSWQASGGATQLTFAGPGPIKVEGKEGVVATKQATEAGWKLDCRHEPSGTVEVYLEWPVHNALPRAPEPPLPKEIRQA